MNAAIATGDCVANLRRLPAGVAQTCVTSPPYFGLRDYGVEGQIGLEATPDAYVARLVDVFAEVYRVLRDDGTLWLNLGDSYAMTTRGAGGASKKQNSNAGTKIADRRSKIPDGMKPKDLIGIPWLVAFALRSSGWYLRSDVIWHKPNPMPEPVTDRPTRAHEYLFLLSKSERYFYDHEAIKEPATNKPSGNRFARPERVSLGGRGNPDIAPAYEKRNRRSVWTIVPKPFKEAHFATFPPALVEPCVLAGSRPGDIVIDPFNGAGTTGLVALEHGRRYWGCELNPEYVAMTRRRLGLDAP